MKSSTAILTCVIGCGLGSSAYAQSSLAGKTLQFKLAVTKTCQGNCSKPVMTSAYNANVYFGTEGGIFDFNRDSNGYRRESGVWNQQGSYRSRWIVAGNQVVFEDEASTGYPYTSRINVSVSGSRCSVSFSENRQTPPGTTISASARTNFCRVVDGRVTR